MSSVRLRVSGDDRGCSDPTTAAAVAYRAALAEMRESAPPESTVVSVTEYVTHAAVPYLAHARPPLPGAGPAPVSTVVVERHLQDLVDAVVELEIETPTPDGLGTTAGLPSDGVVRLDTVLPVDAHGQPVHPGDFVSQYSYCLDRAEEMLAEAGMDLTHVVSTVDYSTPDSRNAYRGTHQVRVHKLGGAVYPCAAGVMMSRLHAPGILVAMDVVASSRPHEAVNPGWSRYDTLTYSPAVRAGEDLFLSGFTALDMQTQQVLYPGDFAAQVRVAYDAIGTVLDSVGLGMGDLTHTVGYVAADAGDQRDLLPRLREEIGIPLSVPGTDVVCQQLVRSAFLFEACPLARFPG